MPQMHDDRAITPNCSSSASSNDAPSEPTIDYSCWSPRSFALQTQQWLPKVAQSHKRDSRKDSFSDHLRPLRSHTEDRMTDPQMHSIRVTKNLPLLHKPRCNTTILQIYFLSAPNPISINSLLSPRLDTSFQLNYPDQSTLRAAEKCNNALQVARPQPMQLKALDLAKGYRSPSQMIAMAIIIECLKIMQGPNQPANTKELVPYIALAGPQNPPLTPSQTQDSDNSLLSQLRSPQDTDPTSKPSQNQDSVPHSVSKTQKPPIPTDSPLPQMTNTGPTCHTTHSTIQILYTSSLSKKGKNKMPPTRRSPRLQQRLEKSRPTDMRPKRAAKNTGSTSTLLFLPDTHESHLDISFTLAIFQSTGLEVNKQIRDLIEEAAKKDRAEKQASETVSQATPTTPLHDLIPPMAVPGFDLPL